MLRDSTGSRWRAFRLALVLLLTGTLAGGMCEILHPNCCFVCNGKLYLLLNPADEFARKTEDCWLKLSSVPRSSCRQLVHFWRRAWENSYPGYRPEQDCLAGPGRLARLTHHLEQNSRYLLLASASSIFGFSLLSVWFRFYRRVSYQLVCSHHVLVLQLVYILQLPQWTTPYTKSICALWGQFSWLKRRWEWTPGLLLIMTPSLVWCFGSHPLLTHKASTPLTVFGDAGCIFCLVFILSRHHSVLWNRALPALTEFISDHWIWPGPLRRRHTRRRFFKGCRDVLGAVLGLTVLVLLLTNSAAKPDPLADKWFSTSSPSSHLTRAMSKQPT